MQETYSVSNLLFFLSTVDSGSNPGPLGQERIHTLQIVPRWYSVQRWRVHEGTRPTFVLYPSSLTLFFPFYVAGPDKAEQGPCKNTVPDRAP